MNDRSKKVIAGFLNLTSSEKKEILSLIKDYDSSPHSVESDLKRAMGHESFSESRKSFNDSTVNFGPRPEGCPYCGR